MKNLRLSTQNLGIGLADLPIINCIKVVIHIMSGKLVDKIANSRGNFF